MVNVKDKSSELFFVQVEDPGEVRKNILETLREIVEVLKSFEKFKRTRHEKLDKINHLRVLLRHATKMLGDLRSKLPQTNLRATVVKGAQKQTKKVHHKKKKEKTEEKAPKKEMTDVEKLEAELNAIETKLKSLS